MAARSPHGLLQLHVQGLGALGRHHPHDLARLHALAAAEGEVDEHGGIALEDLLRRDVGHPWTLVGPDTATGRQGQALSSPNGVAS